MEQLLFLESGGVFFLHDTGWIDRRLLWENVGFLKFCHRQFLNFFLQIFAFENFDFDLFIGLSVDVDVESF